ncbi:EAL domain-containing protein [Acidithiobacillus thiooxidans]|uniref:putative bifunctional diguanylate cyclase/phosphodiesterase n=1 Tax=Acidithiobacillus thiooxidans TaxID=930 RepID=UPI001C06D47A|nr:EAL domain-containing protein [Acidithiobacillus thiooxidans]MBU2839260.1 EAL domain-containing protein [Acidithiobacillus thiooxidans]
MKEHFLPYHTQEPSPLSERLFALLEALPDAFFFKDGAGRWQIVNESAKRLFHLEGIPWEGKTDMELAELHPDFRDIHVACIADDEKAWQAKQLVIVEEKMLREDGQQSTYETRKLPLFKVNGERAGIMIIGRDITAQKEAEERIKQMAFHDDLTDLPNRRFLEIQMEQAMVRATRHLRFLAVCMLDLDGFKPVNDTYGHEAGDEVLITLGKRLPEALRKSDFVARLGGDEFVLLLEDLQNLDDLAGILKKIEDLITAPISLSHGASVQIGASMGVVLYPSQDTDTGDKLLRLADQALYESKKNMAYRDRFWVLFGENPQTKPTPAQKLLDAGALEVWYQPILDGRTRRVVGLEALARLRDTDGALWPPAKFLPQLQVANLSDLTQKVLAQSLTDLSLLDSPEWSLWVSVNLDPRSVAKDCITGLQKVIAQSATDPSRITLEILEGNDFLEQQKALDHLLEIKALGVRLALDDVGSAYNSLLRLKDLPIDEIKLDQGFIRSLEQRPQDLHFVGAIQDLAAGMGVDLVVEGVETEDILDAIMVTGAQFLQGYAIARPMPLSELQAFLQRAPGYDRPHPSSLLGFYAKQIAAHNALKKTIRQAPHLTDYETLADATACPGHHYIRSLGLDDDKGLERLHQDYHRTMATLREQLIASSFHDDWTDVDQAAAAFEHAIVSAYWNRKIENSCG